MSFDRWNARFPGSLISKGITVRLNVIRKSEHFSQSPCFIWDMIYRDVAYMMYMWPYMKDEEKCGQEWFSLASFMLNKQTRKWDGIYSNLIGIQEKGRKSSLFRWSCCGTLLPSAPSDLLEWTYFLEEWAWQWDCLLQANNPTYHIPLKKQYHTSSGVE